MGVPRVSLRGLVAVVFVLAHAGRLAGSEALESASLASAAGPAPSRPPSAAALAELKRLLAVHGAADEAALYQKAVELANGGANGGPALERGRRAAHALLRPLAEVGHTPAMARVARSHLLAEYGARDVPAAVELLRRAADAGEPDAQQQLGLLHSLGLGVEPDAALAVTLYYFAAEGGSTAAQLALAYRHLHGVGVPRDCGRALMYYSPVAERVVAAAQRSGGRGPLLEKTRLTDTSARAGRKALADDDDLVTYYQYSAERGSADAQLALAQLYFHGARGLPQDVALALSYYRQAAEGGEAAAHAHIGHMYVQGIGVAQDNATALHHFRSGAARQHPAALNGLGFMYLHGYGVEASAAKALENFRAAAEKGNPEAQFNLGAMHVSGQGGVRRAYDRALHFFSLAAHQGHTLALFNLGQMHRHGLGAPRSCAVAAHFLKAVSERGDWGADLERALRAYAQRADAMGAALLYAPLAEGGYEVAQANLATVADAAVRRGSARAELPALASAPALALEMLGRAAQQGNVDAQLRIGDYHFYGLGTKEDHEQAVAHYRMASEAQSAQALFNLAYMHAHGLGLPRDLHLAKRHYDLALESAADAFVPVKLAMLELHALQFADDVLRSATARWLRESALAQQLGGLVVVEGAVQWDTLAIGVLSLLLVLVVVIRRQRAGVVGAAAPEPLAHAHARAD